ncbi:MAG: hypothetical protein MPJ52_00270 [Alphaproteobacteria bacterium]|nr:hypothetical protein [Alphaproteobacteria bacterium]MDA7988008.1 hypothetical protein [Alphaproteobacteria bacterium]
MSVIERASALTRFRSSRGGSALLDEVFLGELRQYCGAGDVVSSFMERAGGLLGIGGVFSAGSAVFGAGVTALRLTRERVWLASESGVELSRGLDEISGGLYRADLVAGYVCLRVSGAELLQGGLALDLERAAGGEVWQSRMFRVGVVVVCHGAGEFSLLVPRSYGGHIWEHLVTLAGDGGEGEG